MLFFILGLSIGLPLGMTITSCIAIGKIADLEIEYRALEADNKRLLKIVEEVTKYDD